MKARSRFAIAILALFAVLGSTTSLASAMEGRPLAPTNLQSNDARTVLTWNQPSNNVDVRGWNIYANNTYVDTVTTGRSYQMPANARVGTTYYVIAFDTRPGEPNFSPRSAEYRVPAASTSTPAPTPAPAPAAGAPLAPTNFRPDPTYPDRTLVWTQPRRNGVNVYSWEVRRNGVIVAAQHRTTRYNIPAADRNSGTYTVRAFTRTGLGSPQATFTYGNTPTPTPTPTPAPTPSDRYRRVFADEFSGSTIDRNKWFWRTLTNNADAVNTYEQCEVGNGRLRLHAEVIGNTINSCYLSTHDVNGGDPDQKFGPGRNGTLRVEYRVDLSGLKSEGLWAAGWLFAHDGNPDPAYDGNPATGTEVDVFEYVPFTKSDGTFTTAKHLHPAVHYARGSEVNSSEFGAVDGYVDVRQLGVDLERPGVQVITIEWNRDCQVYSLNGRRIWKNTTAVSTAESHALMLSLEADFPDANGNNIWNHQPGNLINNIRNNNSYWDIYSIRVDKKDSIDAALCAGN